MIQVGDALPAFVLQRASGGLLEWHKGRLTVFSLCAFWCDTWLPQSERIFHVKEQSRGLPIDFWTVSVDGRWAERQTRSRYLPKESLLLDTGSRWSDILRLGAVPYTLTVDKNGILVMAVRGIVRGEAVSEKLAMLLEAQKA